MQYNDDLAVALANFEATYPESNIYTIDVFSTFQDIRENPGAYGLTDVTYPTYQQNGFLPLGGYVTPPVDEYLFWDAFHPTAGIHELIADRAIEAIVLTIPEPSPLAILLVVGPLGALVLASRHRRANAHVLPRLPFSDAQD